MKTQPTIHLTTDGPTAVLDREILCGISYRTEILGDTEHYWTSIGSWLNRRLGAWKMCPACSSHPDLPLLVLKHLAERETP